MKFNIDNQKVLEQIESAKNQRPEPGMETVVTVNKLKPRARKVFYGFHYEEKGATNIGDVQSLEDGSVRKILAII